MLLFRSEQHVDRWCQQWNRPPGGTLSLQQGWKLAQLWYEDRLNPDWRPKTLPEAESVFAEIGLVGQFWKLSA
jgi:Alkylmercury lyase